MRDGAFSGEPGVFLLLRGNAVANAWGSGGGGLK